MNVYDAAALSAVVDLSVRSTARKRSGRWTFPTSRAADGRRRRRSTWSRSDMPITATTRRREAPGRMTAVVLAAGRGRRLQASDAATLTPAQRARRRARPEVADAGRTGRTSASSTTSSRARRGRLHDDRAGRRPADHDALRHASRRRRRPRARAIRSRAARAPTAPPAPSRVAAPQVDGRRVPGRQRRQPLSAAARCAPWSRSTAAASPASDAESLERDSGFTRERVAAFAAIDVRSPTGSLTRPPREAGRPRRCRPVTRSSA